MGKKVRKRLFTTQFSRENERDSRFELSRFFNRKKLKNFLTEKEEKTNLLRIYKYGLKFGPTKWNKEVVDYAA